MKKPLCLFLSLSFALLAGCAGEPAAPSDNPSENSTPSQTASAAPSGDDGASVQPETAFTTQDLSCSRDGMNIYGKIYIPQGQAGAMPAVILSHSFAMTHASMNAYCEMLAGQGYVAYCFDFCGGSNQSKSDGEAKDMTVFTEVADLEAVLDTVRALDYVDSENVFLFGTSQGGLVSALAASERETEVKGLILLYPGLNIADQVQENYGDGQEIPEVNSSLFGTTGRAYVETLLGYDIYAHIKTFDKDVLIVHGSADFIVPISYSERAVEEYPSAQLKVIAGASHGFNAENYSFFGDYDDEVDAYVLEYLAAHVD